MLVDRLELVIDFRGDGNLTKTRKLGGQEMSVEPCWANIFLPDGDVDNRMNRACFFEVPWIFSDISSMTSVFDFHVILGYRITLVQENFRVSFNFCPSFLLNNHANDHNYR